MFNNIKRKLKKTSNNYKQKTNRLKNYKYKWNKITKI